MKSIWKKLAVVVGLLALCIPVSGGYAQINQHVLRVDEYLRGSKLLVSYREGGPVYGTQFFLEVHYCSTGRFQLFGRSEKQTVLDNWQVNNWEEHGQWEVIPFQGKAGVRYVSSSGGRDVVPVDLLPDGRLWLGEGVSIQRQGPAQC